MNTNSEWGIYVEPDRTMRKYYCCECKKFSGYMHTRTVTDRDDNTHREYKIVCDFCSHKGPLHWSKNLAEHSWKAINPNFDNDYISKDIGGLKKK